MYEPPRLRTSEEGARPTSWLEFFFDLVFVVAVDQLARRLEHNVTGHGALVYLALYAPVWWAWVGFVLYTDRFGTDDISDRFLTLLQIGAVLVIAAAALHATSDRALAFALAYGAFRLVLAVRYGMAAHYVRKTRKECARQSVGFAVAGLLWIASAAVPAPWRFWMWGVGFAIDLLTPFASPRMHHLVPPDPDHIEERFGTFINISLGEGFVGLVESMRDRPWSGAVLATAGLSLLIGFSIWWGFFDTLDRAPIAEVRERHRTGPYKIWIFAHLPLAAGVAAAGIAVGDLTREAHAGELEDSLRWLACAMVALCYVAHGIVHIAYAKAGGGRRAWGIVARKLLTIAAALLLGVVGTGLSAVAVAGVLACAAGVQVLWNIRDRARAGKGADPGPGLVGARPSA
ncbi:MAG: low temperature requirement protein A [Acidobacteria bacterium]|nr:low temperature requirement protein A [Acidobacteriota bacterium]